jgi:hypothetical protein
MGKNKRSKTSNDNSDFDEDYFDDYRQERKRKRETRRERRKNKRSMDDAINSEYYYAEDVIERLEYEEEEFRYNNNDEN